MVLYHILQSNSRTFRNLASQSRRRRVYHQFRRNCISSTRSVVYHQAAGKYTLSRDEIQGRLAALDDMRRTSCVNDIPSLREPPKLGKLASGNPYCGLDKQNFIFSFFIKSRRSLVYHPQLVAVYHQPRGLYIINA